MGKIDDKFLVRTKELSDFITQKGIPTEDPISLFIAAAMYFKQNGVVNGERYLWVYQSRYGSELVLAHLKGQLAKHMGEAIGFVGHRTETLDPEDERLRFHHYERIRITDNNGNPLNTYESIYFSNNTKGKRTSLAN